MAGKKKWQYARDADFLAAFPGNLNVAALTYEQYFGLSLNRSRAEGRLTHAMFQALAAINAERLSASFFEPVSGSKEEAEDKAFDWNRGKEMARAMASIRQ